MSGPPTFGVVPIVVIPVLLGIVCGMPAGAGRDGVAGGLTMRGRWLSPVSYPLAFCSKSIVSRSMQCEIQL